MLFLFSLVLHCFDKCFSPFFAKFCTSIDVFYAYMDIIEFHWAWTALLVWSTSSGVLKHKGNLQISRVFIHIFVLSGSAAGFPPTLCGSDFCFVLSRSVSFCLLLSLRMTEKGWAQCGFVNHVILLKSILVLNCTLNMFCSELMPCFKCWLTSY